MEYVIGAIAILLCLFLIGFFTKKKYYKEIDRLEAWKIDVLNRPVLEEMSKVKQLNMTGQTEELFEHWRNEWDEIVTVQLPSLEDLLLDAEEYIDKYRFGKAKAVQIEIETKLLKTEDKIEKILAELNELVGSEEKNRTEIEELKDIYRKCKKMLLAHRHNFGTAAAVLEHQLDEAAVKFKEFDEKTMNGNYLEAREIVLSINEQLETISYKLDIIPHLLLECQTSIPSLISEVKDGYREMLEHGYVLDHIQLEHETEKAEKELEAYLSCIQKTEIDEVQTGIGETKESIELLFDLLEKEVHAKQYIHQHDQPARTMLTAVEEENDILKNETELVLEAYHLSENELEVQRESEVQLQRLVKRYELLAARLQQNDTAQTILSGELKEIKQQLETIRTEQKSYAEILQAHRKEELEAREKVRELTKTVKETIRIVTRSNIPGLPKEYQYLLDDAKESIQNVFVKLEEKPLDISIVQKYLEIAVLTVEKLASTTAGLVDNVILAEKAIQYGNRYRSKYPAVAKGLQEAELAFRSYDYQTALEHAATSIEQIEPGALQKIETLVSKK